MRKLSKDFKVKKNSQSTLVSQNVRLAESLTKPISQLAGGKLVQTIEEEETKSEIKASRN